MRWPIRTQVQAGDADIVGRDEDMQAMQEEGHGFGHDYHVGSPHLKHRGLYERLGSVLRDEIGELGTKGLPLTVLEVGSGHGGYTAQALAFGCSVTATEMSRPSLARLNALYGLNPNFACRFDADGSLDVLGQETFSLVLCASVLHHIPDYLDFLRNSVTKHLTPGGALLSIQDPLWYPGLTTTDRLVSSLAYLSWRVTRGNYVQGARTRLRRLRGVYDESNPLDMVEYHVVRSGVDQNNIVAELTGRFTKISVFPYWSTQSFLWQRVGEILGSTNTFAVLATDFRG